MGRGGLEVALRRGRQTLAGMRSFVPFVASDFSSVLVCNSLLTRLCAVMA